MTFSIDVKPEMLGARLKAARSLKRLTQEAAADAVGVARTTLVAIEGGKRPITAQEFRLLAVLYEVPEGELLDQQRPEVQMGVDFRSTLRTDQAKEEVLVATLLNRLAMSTVQLENLVGQKPPKLDLPEIKLSKASSVDQQAEDAALALRTRLGIGLGPIQDLTALMEFDLGLRVFERPLPSNIGGAVAYAETVGGFVLLNSLHPLYRRRVTAGHEIGHALVRKLGISIHFEGYEGSEREERFFDLFGIALLMPAPTVRKKADELRTMFGAFAVRQLLMMAVFFNVSIEAMTRRMVKLGILAPGTYEHIRSKKIGLKHREQVEQEMLDGRELRPFTPRALLLASIAHQRELLSEQQIASMLELDLVSVRKALEDGLGGIKEGELELSL